MSGQNAFGKGADLGQRGEIGQFGFDFGVAGRGLLIQAITAFVMRALNRGRPESAGAAPRPASPMAAYRPIPDVAPVTITELAAYVPILRHEVRHQGGLLSRSSW